MMICIPIKKKLPDDLISDLKKAQKHANIIEIWFDELGNNLNNGNLKKIFQFKKKPFIYKSFSSEKALNLLLKYPLKYIDLDIKTPNTLIRKIKKNHPNTKLIISFHDFKKTPGDKILNNIAKKIISKGADIIKIATYANNFSDSLRMLNFLHRLSRHHTAICLCMGPAGQLTRTAGHLFGNYLTYFALDGISKTAKGQLTILDLKKCL